MTRSPLPAFKGCHLQMRSNRQEYPMKKSHQKHHLRQQGGSGAEASKEKKKKEQPAKPTDPPSVECIVENVVKTLQAPINHEGSIKLFVLSTGPGRNLSAAGRFFKSPRGLLLCGIVPSRPAKHLNFWRRAAAALIFSPLARRARSSVHFGMLFEFLFCPRDVLGDPRALWGQQLMCRSTVLQVVDRTARGWCRSLTICFLRSPLLH